MMTDDASRPALSAGPLARDWIIGGRKSLDFFSRLLGVGDPGRHSDWKVGEVRGLASGRVRIKLNGPDFEGWIVLKPASSDPSFARAGALDVSAEGETVSPRLIGFLPGLARRLKTVEPGHLAKILLGDPESRRPESGIHAPREEEWCVTDRAGGNPGQWRRFLAGKEFKKMWHWAHATGMVGRILYIVHGDGDCFFFPPDLQFRGMTFLNFPPIHPHSPESSVPETVFQQMATDLRDDDLTRGTGAKLEGFAEAIARQSRRSDMVMISWSCAPTIMGDDLGAVVRKAAEGNDVPIIINSIVNRLRENHFSLFDEYFHAVRKRPGFFEERRDPSAVNLLDVPDRFFTEELQPLLGELAVKVNVRMLPNVPMAGLKGYMRASAQVIPERLRPIKTVERAVADLPLKTVYARSPYGLEDTRAYAKAVAESVGKEAGFEEAWNGLWERRRPEWERLRAEARGCRVAFVVDDESLSRLLDPGFQVGLPAVKMLGEMGFGLDVLVHAPEGKLPEAAAAAARLPWFEKAPALHPFEGPEDLSRLLREGPFQAVYSDIYFDFRITEAGKTPFSMKLFEPGVAGAVRSLKRMVGACRLPFYRRYGRYFKEVPRGRDV